MEEKVEEEKVEEENDAVGEPAGEAVDLGSLTLAELSDMFDKLSQDENRMRRYKEAEAIKSAFYKRLSKEKAEAGLGSKVDEPSSREDVIEEVAPSSPTEVKDNPFEAIETAFKGVYANYKKERAEYNRQQDAQREDNFLAKQSLSHISSFFLPDLPRRKHSRNMLSKSQPVTHSSFAAPFAAMRAAFLSDGGVVRPVMPMASVTVAAIRAMSIVSLTLNARRERRTESRSLSEKHSGRDFPAT